MIMSRPPTVPAEKKLRIVLSVLQTRRCRQMSWTGLPCAPHIPISGRAPDRTSSYGSALISGGRPPRTASRSAVVPGAAR